MKISKIRQIRNKIKVYCACQPIAAKRLYLSTGYKHCGGGIFLMGEP
ncbi:MAG: hypothetical protein ACHQDF_06565 [Chitinophagales bacterium]